LASEKCPTYLHSSSPPLHKPGHHRLRAGLIELYCQAVAIYGGDGAGPELLVEDALPFPKIVAVVADDVGVDDRRAGLGKAALFQALPSRTAGV